MTTKRFTETLSTGIVTDHVTGKEYNCEMRIDDKLLELLNELHEENKRLKSDLARVIEQEKKMMNFVVLILEYLKMHYGVQIVQMTSKD